MRFFSHSLESPSLSKAATVASAASPHADEPPPEYKLVWCDEFDYTGPPDPTKWSYEEGFIRNCESQLYVRDRRENARVEDSALVIEAHKEKFAIPHRTWLRKCAKFTSASLFSKESWQYGRIEVRAKLPHGRGVWPAIWTMGEGKWPVCGEIDLMEFVGHSPNHIHARVHFGRCLLLHRSRGRSLEVCEPWRDFHVYSVEWTAEQVSFFYDEHCYFKFDVKVADRKDGTSPFCEPHHLKINLALGGVWGGAVDDEVLPQQFLIDYVRVFQ